jgi:hypothetical protein
MSQREADGFDAATKLALDRFEALAAEARDALVEERRARLAAGGRGCATSACGRWRSWFNSAGWS